MPKNDNPHAMRLFDSIQRHLGINAAKQMAENAPLSKSADYNGKFKWAQGICKDLEAMVPQELVKTIRMDCACGPDAGKMNKLQRLYNTSASMMEFAEKVNSRNEGYRIETDGSVLWLIYPQCYCSCVKRVNMPLSKAWCFCTLGYTKRMFEYALGREVAVELIQSVKTGATNCTIKIS